MEEQQDTLLWGNRDGTNSLQTERAGRGYYRGALFRGNTVMQINNVYQTMKKEFVRECNEANMNTRKKEEYRYLADVSSII